MYRIGDEYLAERESIERYSSIATSLLPAIRVKPYGPAPAFADDHLHVDIGYVRAVPAEAPDEEPAWEAK